MLPRCGKTQNGCFSCKSRFFRRKSAARVLCAKTVSGKVVMPKAFTDLSYLTVHKWLVGTSPSTWNFGPKWPTSFKNAGFQSLTLSAVISNDKVQLSLIGSPDHHCTRFPINLTAFVPSKPPACSEVSAIVELLVSCVVQRQMLSTPFL